MVRERIQYPTPDTEKEPPERAGLHTVNQKVLLPRDPRLREEIPVQV